MSDQPNHPAQPPANRGSLKSLKECANLGEAFASGEFFERVKQGLPTHLNPNAMLRTYVQAVSKTPLIMKVQPRQAIGAFLTLSQLGLMPNNSLGEAFLIPFARTKWNPATRTREVQGYDLNLVIGYKGYLALAFRSGLVGAVHADVVYPGDDFDFMYGTKQFLEHRPTGKHPDAAAPDAAYAVAHLTGAAAGEPPFRVLPWAEILRTRNRSQAYMTAVAAKEHAEKQGWKLPLTYSEAPWVKHVIPMAMKTAFLRLSTWIPRSLELAGAQALDEASDRGARIDFGGVLDGNNVIDQTIEMQDEEPAADSGFGMRAPDAAPSTPDAPSAPPAAPAAPAPAPAPAATAPASAPETQTTRGPDFAHYLVTDLGELSDLNGGHFRDPMAWVDAYLSLFGPSQDRPTLAENNEEALADIHASHPDAAAHLVAGTATEPKKADAPAAPAAPPAAAADPATIQMPMKGSRMDLQGYITLVRDALAGMTADQLQAWTPVNAGGAVFQSLPGATKRALMAAIERRTAELQPPPAPEAAEGSAATPQPPESGAATPAPADADPFPAPSEPASSSDPGSPEDVSTPERQSDLDWIAGTIGDIRATKNLHELEALARNPAVVARRRIIGERNPDLLKQLGAASDAKAASFAGAR